MSERDEILRGLEPLFERAEREGLWFHCGYQDLWFSPAGLRREQRRGRFLWGAVNWSLRDPKEQVARLHKRVMNAEEELRQFEERVRASGAERRAANSYQRALGDKAT